MKPITVTPVPHEPTRFTASSRSRPGLEHLIDMAYGENVGDKPKPHCHCEENHIKGRWCAHLQAVIEFLCARSQDYEDYVINDPDSTAQNIKDGLEQPERSEDDPRLEDR